MLELGPYACFRCPKINKSTSFNLWLFRQHKTPVAAVIRQCVCCSLNRHGADFPSMLLLFFHFLTVPPWKMSLFFVLLLVSFVAPTFQGWVCCETNNNNKERTVFLFCHKYPFIPLLALKNEQKKRKLIACWCFFFYLRTLLFAPVFSPK